MSDDQEPLLGTWLARGYGALALAGLFGALSGLVVGFCIGILFLFFGVVPGVLVGIPVGYAAALFGAAFGGRRACAVSGGVSGFSGGVYLYNLTVGVYPPGRENIMWFLVMTLPPMIAGLFVGYGVGYGVYGADPTLAKLFKPLRYSLETARLYKLPLEMRILMAAANLAPAALIYRLFIHWLIGW